MNTKLRAVLVVLVAIFFATTSVMAQNYYVSAGGSDSNDGLTSETPFKTISKAVGKVTAGNTVFIMNGTYGRFSLGTANSGSPGAGNQITYKAYAGHNPVIYAKDGDWSALTINASYIIIDGLEFMGDNAKLTYEGALASYNASVAGTNNTTTMGIYNCNGVSIGGPKLESKSPVHVTVRNCKIHDFPGGGFSSIQADYTTLENSIIYNNAWYMMYAGSGVSILCPVNSDQTTGYKNIIRGNICYNNKTTIPWIGITPNRLSDGNGIIIDINQHPYPGGVAEGQGAYTGRTLVENNISYGNGGSGIHAFEADHVDIINNTAYNNGVVMGYADIYAGSSSDVNIFNNIMYSRDGGKCNTNDRETTVYDYNLYFNGTVNKKGPHDVVGNPNFINKALDGTANFRLKGSSPAINTGTNTAGFFAPKDIEGNVRPWGTMPDRGAYEYSTTKTLQTITFNALPTDVVGSADITLTATASSGLPVTFTSSNPAWATITGNTLHVSGLGSAVITASQSGNSVYDDAPDVNQIITVAGANMIANPSFDTDLTGWGNYVNTSGGAVASTSVTTLAGYTGNVAKVTITNGGTSPAQPFYVQLSYPIPLVAGKTYSIKFKASAEANRTFNYALQQNELTKKTWYTSANYNLTTTPTVFGPYLFNAGTTDATNIFKFMLGNSNISVFVDDVEIKEVAAPEINVKQGSTDIEDNTGSYAIGNVNVGNSVVVQFTVENLGTSILNLTSSPRVAVTGTGFSLVPLDGDADSFVNAGSTTKFTVKFAPTVAGAASGTITIANNDLNEAPYNFAITANGVSPSTSINNAAGVNSGINAYGTLGGVKITTSNPCTYKITDLLGREVAAGKCPGGEQFVPYSGKGIYIVLIKDKAIKILIN